MGIVPLRTPISTPAQQCAAVVGARDFLLRLTQANSTRRIGDIRAEARALLRHYPVADTLRPILEEGLNVPPEMRRSALM
jgi:hypothetical protein